MIISFGNCKEEKDGVTYYPILYRNDNIDYYNTIKQITDIRENFVFYLEEEIHGDPRLGLTLLLRIRLSYFFLKDKALKPIFIKLDSDLQELIRINNKYSILLSDLVFMIRSKNEIDIEKTQYLNMESYYDILQSLSLAEISNDDPHNLANEWGALRLWIGYNYLINKKIQNEELDFFYKTLRESYWLLLSKSAATSEKLHPELEKYYLGRLKVIRKCFSEETKILLIDDEHHSGWSLFLGKIFENISPNLKLICYPENIAEIDSENLEKNIKNIVCEQKPNVVLCDIRLKYEDKSSLSFLDSLNLDSISGVSLIKSLKKEFPNLPIIAFTASNKAWTLRKLYVDEGTIDGYWIKENPNLGIDDQISATRLIDLFEQINDVKRHYESISFLWELVASLREKRANELYLNKFSDIIGTYGKDFLLRRLDAIENLLIKSYGFLHIRPTELTREAFIHEPVEMAFIYMWGTINEMLSLRFINKIGGKCFIINSNHQKELYADKDNFTQFVHKYINVRNYKGQKVIKPWTSNEMYPTNPLYVLLLLKKEYNTLSDINLSQEFDELRIKRNNLNFIHGNSINQQQDLFVFLEDLEKLTRILSHTLFLK